MAPKGKLCLALGITLLALAASGCSRSKEVTSIPETDSSLPSPAPVTSVEIASAAPQATGTPFPAPSPTPAQVESPAAPGPTPTPTQVESPTAPGPTPTPLPTAEPSAAVSSGTTLCTNVAAFFDDLTVPDYTPFQQGESFVKTWEVRNEGTCAWENYSLVFASGDNMSGPLSNPLPVISPGTQAAISVNLIAPMRGGAHTSNWEFQDAAGQRFGLGSSGHGFVWVTIKVDYTGSESGAAGSAAIPTTGGCGAARNDDYERQVLVLMNSARAAQGLAPLALQGQLSGAAMRHSLDMACADFISHTGSDGSSWYDRVAGQEYTNYTSARENIYVGPPDYGGTPQGAFDWWMDSAVHRENILNSWVTEVGVAYSYRSNSTYAGYYAVVFARPWNP